MFPSENYGELCSVTDDEGCRFLFQIKYSKDEILLWAEQNKECYSEVNLWSEYIIYAELPVRPKFHHNIWSNFGKNWMITINSCPRLVSIVNVALLLYKTEHRCARFHSPYIFANSTMLPSMMRPSQSESVKVLHTTIQWATSHLIFFYLRC